MSVLGRTIGFSILLTLVFTLVANLLPQMEGEAPREETMDPGELTMDSFVALGESLFRGKGTCTLCHNELGRAPDLLAIDVVQAAEQHLADHRYHGKATDAAGYLHESMVDPGAYVVRGFGKKGSNDTESPMPAVDRPPIQLSELEMDAIIAFLQAKDGNQITVELPAGPSAPAVSGEPGDGMSAAATAEEALVKFGCPACHTLPGSESVVGPVLTDVGARRTPEQIRESIVRPEAEIAEGFSGGVMPGDFATRMTVRELDMIVRFLAEQKG
ncbi:MAG TPA: c-type cytochrome [Gammaproteobacteria bacterium]|nr:c-type cytochrome [Gammaproteobacteria bacterium]